MSVLKQILKYLSIIGEIVIAAGLVLAAIEFLRLQLLNELGMTWAQGAQGEIIYGVHYDLALILTVGGLSLALYAVAWVPLRISSLLLGWFIYIANLSNLLYFKYFGQRLDWWLVKAHILDVPSIMDSAGSLFADKNTVYSIALMVVFTAFVLLCGRYQGIPRFFARNWLNRLVCLNLPLLLAAGGLFWASYYQWNFKHSYQRTGLLSSQIIKMWADQIAGYQLLSHKSDSSFVHEKQPARLIDMPDPAGKMKELAEKFRKLTDDTSTEWWDAASDWPREPLMASAGNEQYPLLKRIDVDPAFVAKMRENLGLPELEQPNVIFLFVESFRAYEYLHPEIGPAIFPELHELFKTNGVFFKTAYSSSWTSGQTARGNFSTQCSMYPNNQGAATYISYSTVRLNCIQQFLKDNGYYTLWTSGTGSKFHNMGVFERLHGMDNFVEDDYYRHRGVKSMNPGWGLKDYEFLAESVKLLNNTYKKEKRPLYVNMATLSTHHPQSVLKGYGVPKNIKDKYVKNNRDYEKFLSRFRYEDAALANFFKKLFASKIGDNTLVVLLGDHSTPVKGEPKNNFLNYQERHSRIAMALVTKNMKKPTVIDWPVHQIDVVPTVAHILGLSGEASWMGRGLFSRPGSPWIYSFNGERTQFRMGRRSCYRVAGTDGCYDIHGIDPLFDPGPERSKLTDDDNALLDEVVKYYQAELNGMAKNKFYPKK